MKPQFYVIDSLLLSFYFSLQVTGSGIKPTGVTIEKPADFKVDARDAGDAPLEIKCTDCFGKNVPVQIVPISDGTKKCTYIPNTTNPHTVEGNFISHIQCNSITTV